jgi:hypothetical protein
MNGSLAFTIGAWMGHGRQDHDGVELFSFEMSDLGKGDGGK